MTNPMETVALTVNSGLTTMMAQSQAFLQNMATTFFNGVQAASSALQRSQATMAQSMETVMASFATQAAKPLLPLQMFGPGMQGSQPPVGPYDPAVAAVQGSQPPVGPYDPLAALAQGMAQGGPGGQWLGQDTAGEGLRATEDYAPLTEGRRQYYDYRGGPGFSAIPQDEQTYARGTPKKTSFF